MLTLPAPASSPVAYLPKRPRPGVGDQVVAERSRSATGADRACGRVQLTEMYARYQEAADAFRHERQERARVEREYDMVRAPSALDAGSVAPTTPDMCFRQWN